MMAAATGQRLRPRCASFQANAADTLSLTIIEAAGLFEVAKWPGSDQSFTALDTYAGGRFWNVSNQINLDLTGAIASPIPASPSSIAPRPSASPTAGRCTGPTP